LKLIISVALADSEFWLKCLDTGPYLFYTALNKPKQIGWTYNIKETLASLWDYKVTIMAGIAGISTLLVGMSVFGSGQVTEMVATSYDKLRKRAPFRSTPRWVVAEHEGIQMDAKGLLDKEDIIRSNTLGWRVTAGDCWTTMNCLAIGDNLVLVPTHGIRVGYQHQVQVKILDTLKWIPVTVTDNNIVRYRRNGDEAEVILVHLGSAMPKRRNIISYFITNDTLEQTTKNTFGAILYVQNKGRQDVRYSENCTLGLYDIYYDASDPGRNVWVIRVIGCKSVKGDCGSPCVLNSPTKDFPLMGINVSGNDYETGVAMITQEMIRTGLMMLEKKEILSLKTESTAATVTLFDDNPEIELMTEIPHRFIPLETNTLDSSVNMKTDYQQLAPTEVLPLLEPYRRPILETPDLKTHELPGGLMVPDFGEFTPSVDSNIEDILADEVIQAMEDRWKPHIPPCRLWTEQEILNPYVEILKLPVNSPSYVKTSEGISISSSAGQDMKDFVKATKRKALVVFKDDHYVLKKDIREYLKNIEEQFRQGNQSETFITKISFKDELRAKEKIIGKNVRSFYMPGFASWYLSKKYFGDFFSRFRNLGLSLGHHAITLDPNRQWDELGQYLLSGQTKEFLNIDFKEWDRGTTAKILNLIRDLIERFYPGAPYEETNVRTLLFMDLAYTKCTLGGSSWCVVGGVKSGQYATTEINCLVNIWLQIYAISSSKTIPPALAFTEPFVVLGDDANVTCPPEEKDARLLAYKACGFTVTSATKGAEISIVDLSETSFLKRKFIKLSSQNKTYWLGMPNHDTLSSLLAYKRKDTDIFELISALAQFVAENALTVKEKFFRLVLNTLLVKQDTDVLKDFYDSVIFKTRENIAQEDPQKWLALVENPQVSHFMFGYGYFNFMGTEIRYERDFVDLMATVVEPLADQAIKELTHALDVEEIKKFLFRSAGMMCNSGQTFAIELIKSKIIAKKTEPGSAQIQAKYVDGQADIGTSDWLLHDDEACEFLIQALQHYRNLNFWPHMKIYRFYTRPLVWTDDPRSVYLGIVLQVMQGYQNKHPEMRRELLEKRLKYYFKSLYLTFYHLCDTDTPDIHVWNMIPEVCNMALSRIKKVMPSTPRNTEVLPDIPIIRPLAKFFENTLCKFLHLTRKGSQYGTMSSMLNQLFSKHAMILCLKQYLRYVDPVFFPDDHTIFSDKHKEMNQAAVLWYPFRMLVIPKNPDRQLLQDTRDRGLGKPLHDFDPRKKFIRTLGYNSFNAELDSTEIRAFCEFPQTINMMNNCYCDRCQNEQERITIAIPFFSVTEQMKVVEVGPEG